MPTKGETTTLRTVRTIIYGLLCIRKVLFASVSTREESAVSSTCGLFQASGKSVILVKTTAGACPVLPHTPQLAPRTSSHHQGTFTPPFSLKSSGTESLHKILRKEGSLWPDRKHSKRVQVKVKLRHKECEKTLKQRL